MLVASTNVVGNKRRVCCTHDERTKETTAAPHGAAGVPIDKSRSYLFCVCSVFSASLLAFNKSVGRVRVLNWVVTTFLNSLIIIFYVRHLISLLFFFKDD